MMEPALTCIFVLCRWDFKALKLSCSFRRVSNVIYDNQNLLQRFRSCARLGEFKPYLISSAPDTPEQFSHYKIMQIGLLFKIPRKCIIYKTYSTIALSYYFTSAGEDLADEYIHITILQSANKNSPLLFVL